MKKIIQKVVKLIANVETHTDHKSIKGKKSGGVEDYSGYKNWRKGGTGNGLTA